MLRPSEPMLSSASITPSTLFVHQLDDREHGALRIGDDGHPTHTGQIHGRHEHAAVIRLDRRYGRIHVVDGEVDTPVVGNFRPIVGGRPIIPAAALPSTLPSAQNAVYGPLGVSATSVR